MPTPKQLDEFIGAVSNATQQYIDGAITSVEYIEHVVYRVKQFDDQFKEPESFKQAS